MVAIFEGYMPAQTRPYGCGIDLEIIKRVENCCIKIKVEVESAHRKPARVPLPAACAG
jgi:hypothetical protein